jgi:serine/threonine protein kinase
MLFFSRLMLKEVSVIGATVSHYGILEKLGGGGRGVVYKAHDTKLERLVALTFLPQHITVSKEANARILREAGAASSRCNSCRSDREDMCWH